MPKIRVLVVDDAVVVRKLLSELLSSDAEIEVAATAANGKLALAKMPVVAPDLMILDVEMPEMDGLSTLTELRKTWPTLPVIMFSSHTQAGAAITLEALHRGATDFVAKPSVSSGQTQGLDSVRDQLVSRIKALCRHLRDHSTGNRPAITMPVGTSARTVPSATAKAPTPGTTALAPRLHRGQVDIIAIGVSTGGPNALAEVIPHLPRELPVPVVIVQHMPPLFTRMLAERLSEKSHLQVVEAEQGMPLAAGRAVIAPGDWHMLVERAEHGMKLRLNQTPPENSCRPAVDPLFRSVAETCGANVLAVVMTGMGQDGTRGAQMIREAGGYIIAQDEASSVVWGMPGSIVRSGLADQVLPLSQLASEISKRASHGHRG
jgi:two-component system chemotaxis response regulator CheB